MAQPGPFKIFLLFLIVLLVVPSSADPAPIISPSPEVTQPNSPVPYTITLFIPSPNTISSTQIMDLINDFNSSGDVLIATSYGLSTYNGTWLTQHMNYNNISEGLMDDFITSIEYDRNGSLWIGYSKGIQIYNGHYYQVIRDQQLLKDTRIYDIQRWNDDMWIATGNSGIHRYRYGTWTWFQPFSEGGPGFYEANGMVMDHESNTTLIATAREGVWIIRSQNDPIRFECIADKDSEYGLLEQVRRDYTGGGYFFNDSTVIHYSVDAGFTPVLTNRDLAITAPPINDLVSGPDGKLYLATDKGIYIWDNGIVYRHLDRFEGIGTSSIVRSIFLDNQGRIWFSTPDNVGYYVDRSRLQVPIEISLVTSAPTATTSGNISYPRPVPTLREDAVTQIPAGSPIQNPGGEKTLLESVIQSIRAFFSGIGLKPRF